jgi:hypothetical protein
MNTKVIDKATAHFRAKISGEMRKIHVPEWECDIWFKEANTLKEEAKLIELAQQGKTVEALVETLIIKARNQDGTKMFGFADKMIFLNEVDPNVVIRIVSEMNVANADAGSVEEATKN